MLCEVVYSLPSYNSFSLNQEHEEKECVKGIVTCPYLCGRDDIIREEVSYLPSGPTCNVTPVIHWHLPVLLSYLCTFLWSSIHMKVQQFKYFIYEMGWFV